MDDGRTVHLEISMTKNNYSLDWSRMFDPKYGEPRGLVRWIGDEQLN